MPVNHPALADFRRALRDSAPDTWSSAIDQSFAPGAVVRMCAPFGEIDASELREGPLGSLAVAWPDMERREHIVIDGTDDFGNRWVGCGGYYCGTFVKPWLGIPPTGHVAHMRYHEFFRMNEDGQVAEVQALWDIPEVMLQAGVWPLAPALGREWHVPGPASQDGFGPHDAVESEVSRQHVIAMLTAMKRHPSEGGPEVMEMDRFWHPKMMWYGPSGIGTGRGIAGFRQHHQIPFLAGMPDRGSYVDEIIYHFMAEGSYVGVTGWPNMVQTLSQGGWLGLPPTGQKLTMRSLDFWRLENGLIRENWVLVDMLDVYDQKGIDDYARMRERAAPMLGRSSAN